MSERPDEAPRPSTPDSNPTPEPWQSPTPEPTAGTTPEPGGAGWHAPGTEMPPSDWRPTPSIPPRERQDPARIAGIIVIVVGLALLASTAVPDFGRFIILVIGLALFGIFFATRRVGFLIAGGIVSGVGLGAVLSTFFPSSGGGLFMASLGAGFVSIFAVSQAMQLRERHWWPLIPGGILIAIGAAIEIAKADPSAATFIWPIAIVAAGAALILSSFLGHKRT